MLLSLLLPPLLPLEPLLLGVLLPPEALPEALPEGGVELPPLELGDELDELEPEELGLFFSVSDEDDGGVLMPELEEDEEPGEDGEVLEVPPVEEPLDVAPLVPLSPDGWSQP